VWGILGGSFQLVLSCIWYHVLFWGVLTNCQHWLCWYTWPKVCGHLLIEHLITKSWALIWSWSPLRCYNSLHQTLQQALCIGECSILLTSAKPRFVCRTARWWSVIHHSRKRISTAPESNGSELYITPADAWLCLGLCVAARPWKPISWSCRRTVIVLKLLPEAVWNSVVSVATENRRFLHITCFSTWGSRSVSLCGLPLRGWAVVAPRCFHLTITALTVNLGLL
jgi:hypothetical protein